MARKNKVLPFVVQPRLQPIMERVGSEESGIIEIRRQGYLSVSEKTIVDQVSADLSDQSEMISAVKMIADKEGRPVTEIFSELQNTDSGGLLEKYAVEIATATSSARNQEDKIRVVSATALLMCRVDSRWGVEDTMELHPDIVDDLAILYKEEDSRSLEAFNQNKDVPEEGVKK